MNPIHPSHSSVSSLYNPGAQCLVSVVQVSSPLEYVLMSGLTNLGGSRVIYTKPLPPSLLTGGIPSPVHFRPAYPRADIQKTDYSFRFFVAVVVGIFEARGGFPHLGQFVRGVLAELPVAGRSTQLRQHAVWSSRKTAYCYAGVKNSVSWRLSITQARWSHSEILILSLSCSVLSKHHRINSTVLSRYAAV
jgi:hypothetical protein